MRAFARFSPLNWIEIAPKLDRDSFYTYVYMRTAPEANDLGVFFMPEEYVATNTKVSVQEVRKHFKVLEKNSLAYYDPDIRYIFLPKMAHEEIGPSISRTNRRWISIQKTIDSMPESPLYDLFFELYGEAYHLKHRSLDDSGGSSPEHSKEHAENENEEALLLARYSDDQLESIAEVRKHLAATRSTGKLIDSVWIKILRSWDLLTVDQVMRGIEIYIDRGYAMEGKKEKYLFAIMKNASDADIARTKLKRSSSGISEVTQHNIIAMQEAKKRLNG